MLNARPSICLHAVCLVFVLALSFASARSTNAQSDAAARIAPKGELRVALITGNSVLVNRGADGKFAGILVDIANAFADKLGVKANFVPYDNVVRYNQSLGKGDWDIGFSARDPSRVGQLAFSEPVVEADYSYVARPGAPMRTPEEVDRAGVKVAVAQGAPVEGYLIRSLKFAQLVRVFGGLSFAKEALANGRADVYGDTTHAAYLVAAELPGATVLISRFYVERISIAVPKSKADAITKVNDYLHEAKSGGTLAEFIKKGNLRGVRPAR